MNRHYAFRCRVEERNKLLRCGANWMTGAVQFRKFQVRHVAGSG